MVFSAIISFDKPRVLSDIKQEKMVSCIKIMIGATQRLMSGACYLRDQKEMLQHSVNALVRALVTAVCELV